MAWCIGHKMSMTETGFYYKTFQHHCAHHYNHHRDLDQLKAPTFSTWAFISVN